MEWSTPPTIIPKPSTKKQLSRTKSNTSYQSIIHTSKSLNNLLHYTHILQGNGYYRRNINPHNLLLLKKSEFDIFYSTRYRYPLLVAETITARTGLTDPNHPMIDRRKIEDPFRQDLEVPTKYQHTLNDYKAYMEYGGSMGHNAPAGQHKTNIDIYNDTFVLTNITPQEMVFNSGLWVLMEQWCRFLGRNTNLERVMVITGSIPSMFDNDFNGVIMNVPSKMFKIICIKMRDETQSNINTNVCHVEILICHNKPYYVNYAIPKYDLSHYLLSHTQYSQFQRESGVDLKKLLEYYGFPSARIKPFRTQVNVAINLTPALRLQMKKSKWFGKLIYAKNLEVLEREWIECQKLSKEFENLEFHQEFYELTKRRLKRGSYISRTPPTNYTWNSHYHKASKVSKTSRTRKHNKGMKSKSKTKIKTHHREITQ